MNCRLVGPKTWDLIVGIFGTRFGQSRTDPELEMVPLCYNYVLNYGFGVVRLKMAMDFGPIKWNQCLVRGLSKDSPLLVMGTVKNSPSLLVGPKMVHVCCKQNIA